MLKNIKQPSKALSSSGNSIVKTIEKYGNVWMDDAYVQGLLNSAEKELYLSQIKTQKDASRQALIAQQSINETDLLKTTGWWSNHEDPYALNRIDTVAPYESFDNVNIDTIWDFKDERSVKDRWLWDTQRYTLDQAIVYHAIYQAYYNNILNQNIVIQDIAYLNNTMPKNLRDIYEEAKKNTMEEARKQVDVSQPLVVKPKTWADAQDPYYNPNQTPVEQRWMYNTARYTKIQADAYAFIETGQSKKCKDVRPYNPNLGFPDKLRYYEDILACKGNEVVDDVIDPFKPPENCNIESWTGSITDLPRYILDYIKCSLTSLEDLVKEIGIDLLYLGIGLLIVGGYLAYRNRKTLASGAKVGASYASNLIPGKQYIAAKQKEAEARGISLTQALREDADRLYNPVGIVQNVAKYQDGGTLAKAAAVEAAVPEEVLLAPSLAS